MNVFLDTFTDASGTPLQSHTPDLGGPWSFVNGGPITCETAGGLNHVAQLGNGGSSFVVYVTDVGYANGRYGSGVQPATGGSGVYMAGLVFRYTDLANHWRVLINTSAGSFALQKVVNTSVMTVAQYSPAVPGTGYGLSVRMLGDMLAVYVDGTQRMTATDAFNQTATKHGLTGFRGPVPYVDAVTFGTLSFSDEVNTVPPVRNNFFVGGGF